VCPSELTISTQQLLSARLRGIMQRREAALQPPRSGRLTLRCCAADGHHAAPARLCSCTRPQPRQPTACARRRPWRPATAAAAPAPSPAAKGRGDTSVTDPLTGVLRESSVSESRAKSVPRSGVVGEGGSVAGESIRSGPPRTDSSMSCLTTLNGSCASLAAAAQPGDVGC